MPDVDTEAVGELRPVAILKIELQIATRSDEPHDLLLLRIEDYLLDLDDSIEVGAEITSVQEMICHPERTSS